MNDSVAMAQITGQTTIGFKPTAKRFKILPHADASGLFCSHKAGATFRLHHPDRQPALVSSMRHGQSQRIASGCVWVTTAANPGTRDIGPPLPVRICADGTSLDSPDIWLEQLPASHIL